LSKLDFKWWINEIVDVAKPSGVRKSNIIKDKGTNVASPSTQFKWTTKLGNVVKLHFDHKGNDSYRIIFYVNDTLFDDAAKSNNGRDPEILSGIFYLLKDRADRIGAQELNFTGHKSDGDTKIVRDINPDKYKANILFHLSQFDQVVSQHQVQMIPPSETKINLWKKLKRDYPPNSLPDFNQRIYQNSIERINSALKNNERVSSLIDGLKTGEGTGDFNVIGYDIKPLIASLSNYDNAIASNSPEGWRKTRNRRTSIYTKLLHRHMSSDWNIEIRGDSFELTRKSKAVPF
jgi:hypothetical protein